MRSEKENNINNAPQYYNVPKSNSRYNSKEDKGNTRERVGLLQSGMNIVDSQPKTNYEHRGRHIRAQNSNTSTEASSLKEQPRLSS